MPEEIKHPAGISPDDVIEDEIVEEETVEEEVVEEEDDEQSEEPSQEDDSGDDEPVRKETSNDKEELYQTRYQRLMARLMQDDPEKAAQFKHDIRKEAASEIEQEQFEEGTTLMDLPVEKALDLIEKRTERKMEALLQRTNEQAQSQANLHSLSRDLSELAGELKLENDQVQSALAEASVIVPESARRQPGGPERWARAVAQNMMLLRLQNKSPDEGRRADAAAEDRVRRVMRAGAPPKATVGQTKKSAKDEKLDKMGRIGPKPTSSLLDSNR